MKYKAPSLQLISLQSSKMICNSGTGASMEMGCAAGDGVAGGPFPSCSPTGSVAAAGDRPQACAAGTIANSLSEACSSGTTATGSYSSCLTGPSVVDTGTGCFLGSMASQ